LLLDRDGIVNVDTGYLHRIEDCRFVDGIFDLAGAFAARGFAIVIATNQAGIGRGYYGEAEFATLMTWMRAEFQRRGVTIAAVYHCPDHPTEGVGIHRRDNPWRKPGPGMFLQAAADHALDLARSWCVGDKASDIAAGRAAGVGTLVLLDPAASAVGRTGDTWIVPHLAAVRELLLRAGAE
jgi:D-glycero-D-manno-heptose 1,7-bisphosphate phosphatase